MPPRRSAAAALLALAGCAAQARLTLPAVGPIGPAKAASKSDADAGAMMGGTLVVYSEQLPASKHRSAPEYPHTGYVIRKASGRLVAQVDNRTADADSEPDEVPLPAGLYEVQARGAKVGTVLVPVVIAPGQRTELYLDAAGMPAAKARGLTDPVTLPDGRVVGARVVETARPAP